MRAMIVPAAGCAMFLFATHAHGQACNQPVGPDVIVGDMQAVANFTGDTVLHIDVFSFATYSCNIGNQSVQWVSSTNQHPVVSQNMFKYKEAGGYGRFEHIGQSWLKHTFLALTNNLCCSCNGQGGSVLGVGCADPYTAGRNAGQGANGCGPKWQVNAATGFYTYPPANPGWTGTVARRLQCKTSELEPSSATVRYFGECQYVTADDAAAGNKNNNASYREVSMAGSGDNYTINLLGTTQRMKPGIRAWKVIDPAVTETDINVPNDGLFIVSSKATLLSPGMWHYEYAVQNLNSDRSGQSFSVPMPAEAVLSNVGFHDVDYHDGDGANSINWDGSEWSTNRTSTSLAWSTKAFNQDASSNAIRWATLYNFRFDADVPPIAGNISLGLFKPGTPASVSGAAVIPAADCNNNNIPDVTDISQGTSQDTNGNGIPDECEVPPNPCHQADFDANGVIDMDDLVIVITSWGACGGTCPPYCAGDSNHSCGVDIDDLSMVITDWGACQ